MFGIDDILSVGLKLVDKFVPDPQAKQEAQIKLLEMQQNGELAQLQADINEQNNVSDRWKSDLSSDSWLSKNVRPMTLVALLIAYFIFASASAFDLNVKPEYVNLLGQIIMLIVSAYFGGRTLEKIMGMKKGNSDAK